MMDEMKHTMKEEDIMMVSDFTFRDQASSKITFYEDRHNVLKHKSWWIALQLVLYLIIIILAEKVITTYFFQSSTVYGTSMTPTLEEKDVLLLDKFRYVYSSPKRFDIVVVVMDKSEGIHYVKRVIGLPGETVQIKDGCVYINGQVLTEDDFCNEKILNAGIAREPITLGKDEYFVMGDNRNDSMDSRKESVGLIQRSQILGKAVFRLRPFSNVGFLR